MTRATVSRIDAIGGPIGAALIFAGWLVAWVVPVIGGLK